MKSITVLISGSGSNLQAIIDAQNSGQLNGKVTQVISSGSKAYGINRANDNGIPSKAIELKQYYKRIPKENKDQRQTKRCEFNRDLANLIIYGNVEGTQDNDYQKPDLIVCAGWMLILSIDFLEPLENQGIPIINLHPALPGAFDGTHAIERAWKAGQNGEIKTAGVMIHKVIKEVDRGEPVLVKELDLRQGESLDDYESRVHDLEHEAIVEGTNIVLGQL